MLIILILLVGTLTGCACATVDSGEVAVKTRAGVVQEESIPPGYEFFWAFWENIHEYSVRSKVYEASQHPENSNADYTDFSVSTNTQDGQEITHVNYTIRFHVNPQRAAYVYTNVGTDMNQVVQRVVKASSRVIVRNTLKNYDASELYSGQIEEAQEDVRNRLSEDFDKNGIVLDFFGLRTLQFNEDYMNQVEANQIAQERVREERFKTEQAKQAKERTIVEAEAQAEEKRISAQAEADANDLITRSLTEEVIMWRLLDKWDGVLPLYGGGDNLVVPMPQVENNQQLNTNPTE